MKYIVLEKHYEYNDEYYYSLGSDIGTPVEYFDTEEEAKHSARRQNVFEMLTQHTEELGGWTEDIDEDMILKEIIEIYGGEDKRAQGSPEQHDLFLEWLYDNDIGPWYTVQAVKEGV